MSVLKSLLLAGVFTAFTTGVMATQPMENSGFVTFYNKVKGWDIMNMLTARQNDNDTKDYLAKMDILVQAGVKNQKGDVVKLSAGKNALEKFGNLTTLFNNVTEPESKSYKNNPWYEVAKLFDFDDTKDKTFDVEKIKTDQADLFLKKLKDFVTPIAKQYQTFKNVSAIAKALSNNAIDFTAIEPSQADKTFSELLNGLAKSAAGKNKSPQEDFFKFRQ